MRCLTLLLSCFFAVPAMACLWDRDTLAEEAARSDDAYLAITGRFPRNPPLYYQLRLERVEREIAESPSALHLYDDAAVACDRLNRPGDGLVWLAKKKAAMDSLPKSKDLGDHPYRYYANLGTLRAHKWLAEGGKTEDLKSLDSAILAIERALEINPEAHFGRERVQLAILQFLKAERSEDKEDIYISAIGNLGGMTVSKNPPKGLITLITLGNALTSPDMMAMLGSGRVTSRGNYRYFARYRELELLKEGKKSMMPGIIKKYFPKSDLRNEMHTESQMRAAYDALRKNANEYHQSRTDYMLAKMNNGYHPDTNSDFWVGYKEPAKVDLDQFYTFSVGRWLTKHPTEGLLIVAGVALSGAIGLAFGTAYVVRRRRRMRATSPTSFRPANPGAQSPEPAASPESDLPH